MLWGHDAAGGHRGVRVDAGEDSLLLELVAGASETILAARLKRSPGGHPNALLVLHSGTRKDA